MLEQVIDRSRSKAILSLLVPKSRIWSWSEHFVLIGVIGGYLRLVGILINEEWNVEQRLAVMCSESEPYCARQTYFCLRARWVRQVRRLSFVVKDNQSPWMDLDSRTSVPKGVDGIYTFFIRICQMGTCRMAMRTWYWYRANTGPKTQPLFSCGYRVAPPKLPLARSFRDHCTGKMWVLSVIAIYYPSVTDYLMIDVITGSWNSVQSLMTSGLPAVYHIFLFDSLWQFDQSQYKYQGQVRCWNGS